MLIANLFYNKKSKQCLSALFIFLSQVIFCQNQFIVKDSITKEKLKFVKIEIDDKNYYTDSLGSFTIGENIDNKFLTIKKSGYYQNKIISNKIKNEILLSPKEIEIEQVIINQKKQFVVGERIYKKSTTYLTDNVQLGVLLKNNKDSIGFVRFIEFFIKKNSMDENRYLELSFSEVDTKNNFSENNTITLVEPISKILKFKNKIDLSSYKIPFGKNGTLIGLKLINKVGSNSEDFSKSVLQFYNSKSKDYMYMRKSTDWIKYPSKTDVIDIVLYIN